MEKLVLRPPQIPMVEWLRTHKRCALWAGMGIGKSSATLWVLDTLRLLGELGDDPVLVVGPMRVARDTWPDEVMKWAQFQDTKIVALSGSPETRLAKLKQRADIFTISYELLPWLVEHFLERWPFKTVVADESDRLKGFREKKGGTDTTSKKAGSAGKRAFQIARVAHNLTTRWIELTGTPSPNGLKDLWGQMWYIDRGARLGRTHGAFMRRWFQKAWDGYGVVPLPHAEKEIHELLSDICLTVDPKDYFDLHEPIVTPIYVKLPKPAMAIYKELEKEMYSKLLDGTEVEVFNAAALTNKCLQLANGAVYTDYPKWSQVHDAKLEALESVQNEAGGMPLLVSYSFKSDVARIQKAFGRVALLATAEGMKQFKAGNARIGLAHEQSLGHGVDGLQYVTNKMVRFGHSWNMGARLQFLERIGPMRQFQAGFDRPMWAWDIIAKDTVDEDVIAAHTAKITVQDALLNAMKQRK